MRSVHSILRTVWLLAGKSCPYRAPVSRPVMPSRKVPVIKRRRLSPFVLQATLQDPSGSKGSQLASQNTVLSREEVLFCSPGDNPRRSPKRHLAPGSASAMKPELQQKAFRGVFGRGPGRYSNRWPHL